MKPVLLHRIDSQNFEEMCRRGGRVIRCGGLVAFPTETVYGLGADALNPIAVDKIFRAKSRPSDNPLIVHVSDIKEAECITTNISRLAYELMDAFWPGPLTLILRRGGVVPDVTTCGLDTVAVRMPAHPVALALIREAGVPIAAPSANTSGKPSPTAAEHVLDDLAGRVDMILDGGMTEVGVESTVVDVTHDPPSLLRPGGIGIERLKEVIGDLKTEREVTGVPRSPGMKYTHYAPEAGVVLVKGESVVKTIQRLIGTYEGFGMRVGLILCQETAESFEAGARMLVFGKRGDPASIARNLFHSMRLLDRREVDVIIVDGSFDQKDVGLAVMNRLEKAASKVVAVKW
ncbi:threonylcarbamoyl-AMP synthase [Methanosarcinales archaeon]|nr:MAG: threonylcarbamoyl-AMP synthase [Methanosarcinales archaeon]